MIDIQQAIDRIIAKYRDAIADNRLTFHEVWTLVVRALATFVQLVEAFGGRTGAEKKAIVLDAISRFYDAVIAPIDIRAVPNIIEPMIDRALKELVVTMAELTIDSLVTIFNQSGWQGVESTELETQIEPY